MARTLWCNNNTETTVWCHLNDLFAGRGSFHKGHDILGFFGCSSCHDVYDGRAKVKNLSGDERRRIGYEAHARTQAFLIENGHLEVRIAA